MQKSLTLQKLILEPRLCFCVWKTTTFIIAGDLKLIARMKTCFKKLKRQNEKIFHLKTLPKTVFELQIGLFL
jgi:hypothetical protein